SLLIGVSFGCKVGADDPVSLASRDSRLLGDWKLTALVDSTINISILGTNVTSVSYNGTVLISISTSFGTSVESYALQVSIAKGGVLTTVETRNGDVATYQDYWEWFGTDKNKSQVLLNDGSKAEGLWDVQRLANKELILSRHTMETYISGGATSSSERTTRLTFEAI
ncbi:MAG: hypothetical protein RLZZ519_2389, partial [Bacteroidota bacterium]